MILDPVICKMLKLTNEEVVIRVVFVDVGGIFVGL